MDTRKATAEYRLSQWMQVIQERQGSGQNIIEFCQEKGISRHAYFYWQRNLRKAACTKLIHSGEDSAPGGWMQLGRGNAIESKLDIKINGCHITVDPKTDPELLKYVAY